MSFLPGRRALLARWSAASSSAARCRLAGRFGRAGEPAHARPRPRPRSPRAAYAQPDGCVRLRRGRPLPKPAPPPASPRRRRPRTMPRRRSMLAPVAAPDEEAVQEAIRKGLRYLARSQSATGAWIADIGYKFNESYLVTDAAKPDVGVTSLALMAFLSGGYFPGRGQYGKVVERGHRLRPLLRGSRERVHLGAPLAHVLACVRVPVPRRDLRDDAPGGRPPEAAARDQPDGRRPEHPRKLALRAELARVGHVDHGLPDHGAPRRPQHRDQGPEDHDRPRVRLRDPLRDRRRAASGAASSTRRRKRPGRRTR